MVTFFPFVLRIAPPVRTFAVVQVLEKRCAGPIACSVPPLKLNVPVPPACVTETGRDKGRVVPPAFRLKVPLAVAVFPTIRPPAETTVPVPLTVITPMPSSPAKSRAPAFVWLNVPPLTLIRPLLPAKRPESVTGCW